MAGGFSINLLKNRDFSRKRKQELDQEIKIPIAVRMFAQLSQRVFFPAKNNLDIVNFAELILGNSPLGSSSGAAK